MISIDYGIPGLDPVEYEDSSGNTIDEALEFNQKYVDDLLKTAAPATTPKVKVKNEVNPEVQANEEIRYAKEVDDYIKKQNEIKLKYKKAPVADVRGEIYREDKNNANANIGLAALGIAGGLGLIGLANRRAIAQGIQNANEFMVEKGFRPNYHDSTPTGEHYATRNTSMFTPMFKEWKKEKGINTSIKNTPMTRIGELAAQGVYDIATHGSQRFLWMLHPLDLMGKAAKKGVDPAAKLGGPGQALLGAAALQAAIPLTGAYDITNPSELFRPEGFKQNNPDSEDPRVTTAPAEEIFQRFLMGRTGRPLKFSAAKEEIPDLTFGRYKDYMNFMYHDKGLLNLGLAKATDENLHGVPEARVLGYPVTVDALSTFAGGILGSAIGTTLTGQPVVDPVVAENVAQSVNTKISDEEARQQFDEVFKKNREKQVNINLDDDDNVPNVSIKRGSMKTLLGGLGGVAAGAIAGHFLGKFIEDRIKEGNDAYRQQQEIDEGRWRPKGYYLTNGNNEILSV